MAVVAFYNDRNGKPSDMQSNTHMLHLLSKMIANRLRFSSAPQLLRALPSYQSELIPVNSFLIKFTSNRLKQISKNIFYRDFNAFSRILLNALSGNSTQRYVSFPPNFNSLSTAGQPAVAIFFANSGLSARIKERYERRKVIHHKRRGHDNKDLQQPADGQDILRAGKNL